MTPPISERSWFKPTLLALSVLTLMVLGMQAAGLVFCGMTKAARPMDVTPYTIYQYWYWYGQHPIWRSYLYASSTVGLLTLLLPFAVLLVPGQRRKLHGDAKWSTRTQMRAAGLLGTAGIVVGKLGSKFLIFDGTAQGKNVLAAAPPGSGKTQSLMIPNCLNWPGSLVALDTKGDCYARTAGFRASVGQAVYQLNFLSREYRTHQYDPFAYVSTDPNFRVSDIEKIANYLCPNPPPPTDPFWAIGARDMFRAIALYLFDTKKPCTLGTILDVVETPEELQTFARRIVKEVGAGTLKLNEQSVRDFAKIAHRPDKTHGGVKDQLTASLAPLKNPLVRFATSANTFDLRELRCKPMSVYLTVARPDIPALRPIINLFFQQLVDLNMVVEYGTDPRHANELLLGLDEFAQLGRLDAVFEGITFFRSFGIRALVLLQSPSQNRTTYSVEGAKTFEQSFDCSVFFTPAPRDVETAELVSRLLGNQTVKAKSESKKKGFETRHDSTSISDQKRPLLLPQEVLRMPIGKQIILISGLAPIYANKIAAWKDPVFQQREGKAPLPPAIDVVQARAAAIPIDAPDGSVVAEVLTRPVEVADMANLDNLKLADFSHDFASVEVPPGNMTPDAMATLRDRFFDSVAVA